MLKKRIDKDDNDNKNSNNTDVDDNDDEDGGEELLWRFNDLRGNPDLNDNDKLICRFNEVRQPIFWDVPPFPSHPLQRTNIQMLMMKPFWLHPKVQTFCNLKTHFDDPITNLIDQANNVIQMMPKNKRNEDDNLHLSEQLSKYFPEVDVQRKIEQDDDENIGEKIIWKQYYIFIWK